MLLLLTDNHQRFCFEIGIRGLCNQRHKFHHCYVVVALLVVWVAINCREQHFWFCYYLQGGLKLQKIIKLAYVVACAISCTKFAIQRRFVKHHFG